MKREYVWLVFVVVIGLALRLDFLFANNFVIDSDEAIVGLMAKHILEGRGVPIFYYGQHYMGSFESLMVAAVISVFGVSSVALKSVPLAFSLLFIALVYELAFEISGKIAARFASLFAALAPSALIVWSAKARGGFIELVCIGTLALLFTLRWSKEERLDPVRIALVAALLGFGWWVNNQIIFFMLPIGFLIPARILWWDKRIELKLFTTGLAATLGAFFFFVGSLPYWVYNLKNRWISLDMFERSSSEAASNHFAGVFDTALPIILGAKRFWQNQDLFYGSSIFLWTLYGLLFGALLFTYRRAYLRLFAFRIEREAGIPLLSLFIFAVLSVFCLSSFGYLVEAPRYLLPLYAGVFPLLGVSLALFWQRSPKASYLLAALVLFLQVGSCYLGGRAVPGEPFVFRGERASKDHTELIRWLADKNIAWVKSNYWIGYRLAYETAEQVKFKIAHHPHYERIDWYEDLGSRVSADRFAYVLVPAQGRIYKAALDALGLRYRERMLSGYHVIYDVKAPYEDLFMVEPEEVLPVASVNPDLIAKAFDRDVSTRWASASPQNSEMSIQVELREPRVLRAFRYDLGAWAHDYPRRLRVELELQGGVRREVLSPTQFKAVRYFMDRDTSWEMYFTPEQIQRITLSQVGRHQVLDWSIAELELFG